MAKSKKNPRATKRALLKAAGEVLTEKGLYGFHVHEVAKVAGYGKPLLYRYFGARREVLGALALAKAKEISEQIGKTKVPEKSSVPGTVYRQVMFARILAKDEVLQWLFRAQLNGELGKKAGRALDGLIPVSDKKGDEAAAEAFLLAGISYVLLLRNSQKFCAGVPIETPKDLTAFERAFVALSERT